jgi:uncharacterized linocin/CFP29 family protein
MEPVIDFVGNGQTSGEVAGQLQANGLNIAQMRPFWGKTNKGVYTPQISVYKGSGDRTKPENYRNIQTNAATLRRDEWKQLDEALLPIMETRLVGVQDLISRGLVFNLGNAMGTTVLEYHDISDAMEADLTMDGVTRSKGDRPVFNTNYLPIPIIHADYEINARALEASRKLGNPLDVTSAERAGRKVAEKVETMLFTDTDYSFGGGTIYSYLNYPDINTVTLGTNWDASGKTGAQIVEDVRDMKQASIEARYYGPWVVYIPTNYETKMDEDYSSSKGSNTIRERILQIAGITDVKVVDKLPDDNVLLVQMTSDVVRLVQGLPLTNVEWMTEGKFVHKYKVLSIQVPQIRSDQEGHCGITLLA